MSSERRKESNHVSENHSGCVETDWWRPTDRQLNDANAISIAKDKKRSWQQRTRRGCGSRGWERVVAAGFKARHRIAGTATTSNGFAMTQGGRRMSALWNECVSGHALAP